MSITEVAVVGAGIGGLCLAQNLRRRGIQVVVFERDHGAFVRSQGFRFTLRDTDTVLRGCLPEKAFEAFDQTSGHVDTIDFLDDQLTALASTTIEGRSVDRHTFRHILLAGLDIRFGHEFTQYKSLPDGRIRVDFANGVSTTTDLLVGADGINSAVRRQLLPDAQVTDLPMSAVVGRSWTDSATGEWLTPKLAGHLGMAYGPNHCSVMFGHMRFPNGTGRDYVYWGFLYPSETVVDLAGALRAWHPGVSRLVHDADPDQTSRLRLRTSIAPTPWLTSNVTLLGDAIHAMSPFQGSGANTAIRDAELLGTQWTSNGLAGIEIYETALREYRFDAVYKSAIGTADVLAQRPVWRY